MDELLDTLTSQELTEWKLLFRLHAIERDKARQANK